MKIILKTARKNKRSVLWMYNRPLKLQSPSGGATVYKPFDAAFPIGL